VNRAALNGQQLVAGRTHDLPEGAEGPRPVLIHPAEYADRHYGTFRFTFCVEVFLLPAAPA
jgi:hypothetical protein